MELDFANISTGDPSDTILFAGENGTGKTTILESISTFLNRGSFEHFEYIKYIVDGKPYTATPLLDSNIKDFYTITDDTTGTKTEKRSNKENSPELIDTDPSDIRRYGCVFSKARADYRTSRITSTTTKLLDSEKYDIDQEDDFTSLKQLIVDIETQDNADYADINRQLEDSAKLWKDFYLTSKISRFKNAFDNFFEQKIKYEKVTDINSEKEIVFKKNNTDIYIDKLSTGEKQIVFRGIYLLKNSNNLNGAAIMIDEPELSMHPKWQKKSLKYYKDLFTESNSQKAQLFIATHSDHVLKEALGDQAKNTVIVLKEDSGAIIAKKIVAPSVLPEITSAETNYLAFDITSIDYHIELYGWLQQRTSINTRSVKGCDDFIKNHQLYQQNIHSKPSSHEISPDRTTHYETICTYIRNAIHHPDSSRTYTELEFKRSIELLIELCKMPVDSTVVTHS